MAKNIPALSELTEKGRQEIFDLAKDLFEEFRISGKYWMKRKYERDFEVPVRALDYLSVRSLIKESHTIITLPIVVDITIEDTDGLHSLIDELERLQGQEKDNIVYEIEFVNDDEITLNGKKVLSKPQYDSQNYVIFRYLMKHPNVDVTVEELKQEIIANDPQKKGTEIRIVFDKFLENLGFTKDLRKTFFKNSKQKIRFYNPITIESFKKRKLPKLDL